ncbi:ShlB/FhaC/HecB family hemolysin secretion/activation protein [Microbulbifer halophilus]|uniref:ShlB/FhaC/HecB family hemolysin secretion/activation protein n=1 Tax=Microbulbifer halophilus TaxID=453963 RepID=A0ABW5EEU9_9GAMM|nr:ShlB/FhaC/HecB family hemolysin secretion/activation protein [Microbulbifer halophilus]MCW8125937.1 ShlB/FhaC/HecB family hemolysin secretion/activation protein [Microbulbifer halophilus]
MSVIAGAQSPAPGESHARELQRQQQRERALRGQNEPEADVRLNQPDSVAKAESIPTEETPCFPIREILLEGEEAHRFRWALKAADPAEDPATGHCLGTAGINIVMERVQNAIIARGYVTTRVLAAPQDLNSGTLTLTLVPGRISEIRFADGTDPRANFRNALPAETGELLNLRDIEQGLENFQRVPTVAADIRIAPADRAAGPGKSNLLIAWEQPSLVRTSVSLDDSGSESTGKLQAGATLSVDNGWMLNDLFYINLGHSVFNGGGKSTDNWTAHYEVPYGYWLWGTTVSSYDYRQTVVGPYASYTYSGTSRNAELRASRLLFRDADSKTGAYARGWWRKSHSFIDDTRILAQSRRTAGWEAGFTHKQFWGAATLNASLAYRRGTGALGAQPAPEENFGEGTSRMKMITASARLDLPFRIGRRQLRYNGSWRAQWNRTRLVPQDRFAIGGRYTVRGFDGETTLTAERGWLLRNELSLVLGGGQQVYLGLDYGRIAGPAADWQLGNELAGAALGLRGGWGRFRWDTFAGTPIEKPRGFPASGISAGFSMNASF